MDIYDPSISLETSSAASAETYLPKRNSATHLSPNDKPSKEFLRFDMYSSFRGMQRVLTKRSTESGSSKKRSRRHGNIQKPVILVTPPIQSEDLSHDKLFIHSIQKSDTSTLSEVNNNEDKKETTVPVPEKLKKISPLSLQLNLNIGGRKFVTEALQTHKDLEESHSDFVCALQHREQRYLLPWEKSRLRQRRMSTPHPIKSRPSLTSSEASLAGDHVNSSSRASLLRRMKKCRSVPNLSVTQPNKKQKNIFHATSAHAGDLALQSIELNDTSDDEATSEETVSIGAVSEASSSWSTSKHTIDQMPTYAEALWDHVTLDLEELAFQVGEVIKVTDVSDKDWWFGVIDDRQGWFPAAFVRLHANQMDTADDFVSKVKAGHMDGHTVLQKYSSNLLSKDQARTNVVTEIINAEREYVKHLRDVVEVQMEHDIHVQCLHECEGDILVL